MTRVNRKALRRGSYRRRAEKLVRAAYADPATVCRRCGRTYAEGVRLWGKARAAWQGGHIVDSHPLSPLAPEHATCNASAGAKLRWARDKRRRAVRSPNA